ncbi:MAG: CapA family protein [Fimbriimonadaceae bacterium]
MFLPILAFTALTQAPTKPITLRAVGDVMLGREVEKMGTNPFRDIAATLKDASLTFANLECALSWKKGDGEKRFRLRASPRRSEWIKEAGIDIVSLANNHAADAGTAGFFETIFSLGKSGVVSLAEDPVQIEVSGTKIAFVAYTDFKKDACPGMSVFSLTKLKADITRMTAPIRIVSIHWGDEGQNIPTARQRELAKAMSGLGVDLILGHGPHLLQPVERVGNCLVAYSLGDFVFDIHRGPRTESAILEVNIHGPDVTRFRLIPVVSGFRPKLDSKRKLPRDSFSGSSSRTPVRSAQARAG